MVVGGPGRGTSRAQFLSESASLGTVGGVAGAALGIVTVLAVAVGQEWSAIIPTWLPASAGSGTITGVIAGLYPSWRATRIEAADALRR